MMDNLVLHPSTRTQLQHFAANPGHAVLLTGPTGIGKAAIAEALAAHVLGVPPASHPYFLAIRPEGLSIPIDTIRALQKFLTLKTTGQRPIRRVVVLEHAHTLTTEAQNAFLKLLEEPPADTLLILTANTPRALLPTILSRTQTISISVPESAQLQELITNSPKDEQARQQAYFLSGGLPGLLHALLHDEEHPLITSVAQAKEVLQKATFERLAMVDALSKQRETALGLVEALERIAQAGLNGSASKQDLTKIKQWHKIRKAALEARSALQRSANAKLVLDNLFLGIS